MNAVRKLPGAQNDLLEIWLHIAADSRRHADHFLDRLDEKMRLLAASPRMGRLRPELSAGLRSFPVDDYVVFYREADQAIEIVRVLHSARDIEAIFRDSPASAAEQ
jgi:toxin ParE1/3/4